MVPKNGKICTFYTKNEVFAQNFHLIVQIREKKLEFGTPKCTFGPLKMEKFVLFTLKIEVFAQKFHPIVQIGVKTGV